MCVRAVQPPQLPPQEVMLQMEEKRREVERQMKEQQQQQDLPQKQIPQHYQSQSQNGRQMDLRQEVEGQQQQTESTKANPAPAFSTAKSKPNVPIPFLSLHLRRPASGRWLPICKGGGSAHCERREATGDSPRAFADDVCCRQWGGCSSSSSCRSTSTSTPTSIRLRTTSSSTSLGCDALHRADTTPTSRHDAATTSPAVPFYSQGYEQRGPGDRLRRGDPQRRGAGVCRGAADQPWGVVGGGVVVVVVVGGHPHQGRG